MWLIARYLAWCRLRWRSGLPLNAGALALRLLVAAATVAAVSCGSDESSNSNPASSSGSAGKIDSGIDSGRDASAGGAGGSGMSGSSGSVGTGGSPSGGSGGTVGAGTGGSADAGSTADSGTDADSGITPMCDGGVPGTDIGAPGDIRCGDQFCAPMDATSAYCCAQQLACNVPCYSFPRALYCDGPEDCPASTVCCAEFNPYVSGNGYLDTVCLNISSCVRGHPVCHVGLPSSCPTAYPNCTQSLALPCGYGFCH